MHVLWRAPGEVQIGVDAPRILTGLTDSEEKALLSAPRLAPAAREKARRKHGISEGRWHELTRGLDSDQPPRPVRGTVAALDSHPLTERVRGALDRMGVACTARSRAELGNRVAVLTDDWVTDPERVRSLMAADVPHLPIVVESSGVIVGPTVVPGATPCTMCVNLARAARDPKWPVVAAQLMRLPARPLASAESETAAALAAHALTGLLDGRVSGGWHVSADRCLAIVPPPSSPCGCGGITRLYEDVHALV